MRTAYKIVCPNCVSNHQIISKLFVHIVCCMTNLFFCWANLHQTINCVSNICARLFVQLQFFCTHHHNICAPVEFFAHVPFCTGRFSPKLALLSMCGAVCMCVHFVLVDFLQSSSVYVCPFCTGRFSPKFALLSMCDAACMCVYMCIYTCLYIDFSTVLWETSERKTQEQAT